MIMQELAITKVQDSGSAIMILDEIVVVGGHQPTELRDGFVVYSKNKGGVTEELFVRKIGDEEFQVVRRTIK